jgi:hypothetical protein
MPPVPPPFSGMAAPRGMSMMPPPPPPRPPVSAHGVFF